jgi:hypothetical protein
MPVVADFQARLTVALARELADWQLRLSEETMCIFDCGCYPWHGGYIELSFLATNEPGLRPVSTSFLAVAEWRPYDFVPRWPLAKELAANMKRHWELAKTRRASRGRILPPLLPLFPLGPYGPPWRAISEALHSVQGS